ncbi:MAG TPA: DUF881 domain-containing protein [Candidatus Dormibacteraeota bacterium]|nr:DUF881 domain-containing protein [Candidatus Dormibacteraeota bacterium]
MGRTQPLSTALVALVALALGFLLAGQVKAQLVTPSNQVERNQALVRSVQDLERTNEADRAKIASLRADIDSLESQAAAQSQSTLSLQNQVADLRAHAGLTALHGPAVEVVLTSGPPGADPSGQDRNLVTYEDVQDLVNLLFASGAEAVAVSGRRITPLSSFSGSEGEVIVDQGPPLFSPIKITAVGDRNRMESALGDPNNLPSLRVRQVQFGLTVRVTGAPNQSVPAYDAALETPHVSPA